MKKIFCILVALMLMFPVYAQRGGGSSRSSSSPTRSSVSTSRTSVSRSSTPRSTVTYSSRTSSPTRSNSTTVRQRSTTSSNNYTRTRTEPARANTRPLSNGIRTNSDRPHNSHPTAIPHHNNPPHHPIHHHGVAYRPHHYCIPPHHHHPVHIRPIRYVPVIWTPGYYWYGWWSYCYLYPTQDIVIVRQYVNTTYSKEIVAYTVFDDLVYTIVKEDGSTYIEIFAKNDELIFKYKIGRRYQILTVDADMNGVWIEKPNHKDPIFVGHDDEFFIYEVD